MGKHICFMANAASVHVVRWVNYFAEHEWTVDLITWHLPSKNSGVNLNPSVNMHRIFFPPHFLMRYGALLEIARLIKRIQPDIIHAHFLGTFGILAIFYGRIFNFRPIVISTWGAYSLANLNGVRGFFKNSNFKKFAIKNADFLHCDGDNIKDLLIKLGADPNKIGVIYFGVDVNKFMLGEKDRNLLNELELDNSPVVISLRRMDSRGGVEYLIRAIPLVLKDVPEAKFIVVGKGTEETKIKELASSLNVSEAIRFLGWVSNDKIPQYLLSSDLYVSTSLYDGGLAASTAEAMACGLPVIITNFGDNIRWVKEGVNGFLIQLDNPESITENLAKNIICLLQDEKFRRTFGRKNREIIENENNFYKEMSKMSDIYLELIRRCNK